MRRALVLLLVGSGLVLLADARSWSSRVIDHGAALPLEHVRRTGHELAPGLRSLALVGLAAVVALLASRGWARRLVGLLVAGCGAATVDVALAHRDTSSHGTGWPYVAVAGGLVLLAGGLLALARGHRWIGLSDSYRTPAARATQPVVTDKGVWDALDRGEDPTAEPPRPHG